VRAARLQVKGELAADPPAQSHAPPADIQLLSTLTLALPLALALALYDQ
jgi:hypothetical protein